MINIGTLLAVLRLQDKMSPALAKAETNLKKTGEKLKSVKNGKNFIIHIRHEEYNAKRISSIAFIFQKLVE